MDRDHVFILRKISPEVTEDLYKKLLWRLVNIEEKNHIKNYCNPNLTSPRKQNGHCGQLGGTLVSCPTGRLCHG